MYRIHYRYSCEQVMNEAKQQRPLELRSSGVCLAHPKGWFLQTRFNDLLTYESKGQVCQSLA